MEGPSSSRVIVSDLSPSSTDVLSWSDQDGSQSKDGSQSSRGERLAQVKENYLLGKRQRPV